MNHKLSKMPQNTMEYHEIFYFFTILKQSLKILHKNVKFMASITLFSLILTSISLCLFIYSSRFLLYEMVSSLMGPIDSDSNSSAPISISTTILYFALFLVIYVAFLFAIVVISIYSDRATVIVSSMSFTTPDKTLSFKDLFSKIKKPLKRPALSNRLHMSRRSLPYLLLVILLTTLVMIYPNPITISIAILFGVIGFVFTLYLSVVWALAIVVSMLEEDCYRERAIERAEELVKGHRLHGFMLNLFVNLLVSIIFLIYYCMVVGSKGVGNMIILWLFVLNISLLVKILMLVAYTVLYFECKKHIGEDIESIGNIEYTKLSTAEVLGDIP